MSLAHIIVRLSAASPAALPVILDAAIKSVVILLLAACATFALRRASAAARFMVWLLGLASLLLLPILSAALPAWQVLPGWSNAGAGIVPTHAGTQNMPRSSLTPSPRRAGTDGMARVPEGHDIQALPSMTEQDDPSSFPADRSPRRPATRSIETAAAPAAVPVHLTWQTWLILAWIIGAGILLAQILLGFASLVWLRRRSASMIDGTLSAQCRELSAQLGIRRRIELLSSPERTMPMVWGIFHIHLLLPADARGWTDEQCRAVLLHELAHARRNDCLWQLLAQIIRAVYWFNPLAWFAWRQMQLEREMACDDLVLRGGARPSAYAEQLLHIASAMHSAPLPPFQPAAIAMARPGSFEGRLLAILDAGRNRKTLAAGAVIATLIAALAVTTAIAMLRSTPAKPISASITLLADRAGDPLAKKTAPIEIDKPADVAALSAFFPQLGKTAGTAAGWPAGAQIVFHYPDGRKSTVVVSASDGFGLWTEGRGDWDVHGDLAAYLNKLRPDEASDAGMSQARFGTTVMRTIETPPDRETWNHPDGLPEKPTAGAHFLCFRSGAIVGLPSNLLESDDDAAKQWLENQGVDVVADQSLDDWNAREIDSFNDHVRFKEIDRDSWDNLRPTSFDEKWHSDGASRDSALSDTIEVADWARLPRTFLFETRNGDRGMLQILRMVNAPDAIQIRYRLIENANAPANPPATDTISTLKTLREEASVARLAQIQAEADYDAALACNGDPQRLREMAGPALTALLDPPGQTLRGQLSDVQLQIPLLQRKGYAENSPLMVQDRAMAEELQKEIDVRDKEFARAYVQSLLLEKQHADGLVRIYTDALETGVMLPSPPSPPATQPATAPANPQPAGSSDTRANRSRYYAPPYQPEPADTQPATRPADSGDTLVFELQTILAEDLKAQYQYDKALEVKDDPEKLRNLAGPDVVKQLDPQGERLRQQLADVTNSPATSNPALAAELEKKIKVTDQQFAAAYLKKCHDDKMRYDAKVAQLQDEISKKSAAARAATQPATTQGVSTTPSNGCQFDVSDLAPPDRVKAPEKATYALIAGADPKPINSAALDKGDEFGFVKSADGKVAAFAKGTTIPLPIGPMHFFWMEQPASPTPTPAATQPASPADDADYAAKLAAANRRLRDVKQQFDAGVATAVDYERAKGDVQILQAGHNGDPAKLAEARLAVAQAICKIVQSEANAGLASATELHDAQSDVTVRQAELDVLRGKATPATQSATPATNAAAPSASVRVLSTPAELAGGKFHWLITPSAPLVLCVRGDLLEDDGKTIFPEGGLVLQFTDRRPVEIVGSLQTDGGKAVLHCRGCYPAPHDVPALFDITDTEYFGSENGDAFFKPAVDASLTGFTADYAAFAWAGRRKSDKPNGTVFCIARTALRQSAALANAVPPPATYHLPPDGTAATQPAGGK